MLDYLVFYVISHKRHTHVYMVGFQRAWGVTVCRSSLPFARECRLGVWFGFVGAALLPAVGTCVVLAFGAMPGRCCFLRVTHTRIHGFIVMAFCLVALGSRCFLLLSSAVLIVVLVPGYCSAYSAFAG